MFKPARWRSEKNKIKAVFRLQFHATQVLWLGGDTLMISVVPPDGGKPTSILDKVKVRDGSCYWEKPVYEIMKFTQDPKTGKTSERLYHFIISTGLSKFSVLGEVSVDFADYVVATKISSLSFPVKNSKFEAMLHVVIERIQDSGDQREIKEGENSKDNSKDKSLRAHLSKSNMDEDIDSKFPEDGSFIKMISHVEKLNENCSTSGGSDIIVSSSESSSGHNTPRLLGVKDKNTKKDRNNFLAVHQRLEPEPDVLTVIYDEQQGSQSEWSGGSFPDVSTDDSSHSPCEALISDCECERSEDTSGILIEKLKTQLAVLARQSEVTDLELQTLRKSSVTESKRAQDLSKEVVSLKEERDALKEECKKLKALQKRADEAKARNKLQFEGGDPWALVEELRQELNHEKDLNANLLIQLQKTQESNSELNLLIQLQKTQESNSELILAVHDLDEMLEEKHKEILNISNRSATTKNSGIWETNSNSKSDTDLDEDQKELEKLLMQHTDANDVHLQEQKIIDLCAEVEICRSEGDDLEMQLEQLALDYEILKQENHDISNKLRQSQLQDQLNIQFEFSECEISSATLNELESKSRSLENELNKQSTKLSDTLLTVSDLENHVTSLEEELEKQARGFEADLESLTGSKVEQEQRAIRAEETLRKTRRQNASTADRLQEEFRRLSEQMSSTFHANEKLATKALTKASELRLEKNYLGQMLKQAKEELQSVRENYEAKLLEHSKQLELKANQMEMLQSEVEFKSIEFRHKKMHEEETERNLPQKIVVLQSEIERLERENTVFSNQTEENKTLRTELKQMKASVKDTELLLEKGNTERLELEILVELLKKEAQSLLKELDIMRTVKDEEKSMTQKLLSEMEILRTQYEELKQLLAEEESQKEKLQKQVIQLKGELKKKEDALSIVEKKIKDCNGQVPVSQVAKARDNKYVPAPCCSKELVNLKEKIRLLESQIKLKEAALEKSSNSFLAEEQDLQKKIEDSEKTLEMVGHNAASFCSNECPNVRKEAISGAEDLVTTKYTSDKVECPHTLTERSSDNDLSENELKDCPTDSRDDETYKLLNEMALLKKRNQSMECELRDMQQRYSDISLKFAEVEGERQQLVMTLRTFKNSSKSWSLFT